MDIIQLQQQVLCLGQGFHMFVIPLSLLVLMEKNYWERDKTANFERDKTPDFQNRTKQPIGKNNIADFVNA